MCPGCFLFHIFRPKLQDIGPGSLISAVLATLDISSNGGESPNGRMITAISGGRIYVIQPNEPLWNCWAVYTITGCSWIFALRCPYYQILQKPNRPWNSKKHSFHLLPCSSARLMKNRPMTAWWFGLRAKLEGLGSASHCLMKWFHNDQS
jgi:hypothetical protein